MSDFSLTLVLDTQGTGTNVPLEIAHCVPVPMCHSVDD